MLRFRIDVDIDIDVNDSYNNIKNEAIDLENIKDYTSTIVIVFCLIGLALCIAYFVK